MCLGRPRSGRLGSARGAPGARRGGCARGPARAAAACGQVLPAHAIGSYGTPSSVLDGTWALASVRVPDGSARRPCVRAPGAATALVPARVAVGAVRSLGDRAPRSGLMERPHLRTPRLGTFALAVSVRVCLARVQVSTPSGVERCRPAPASWAGAGRLRPGWDTRLYGAMRAPSCPLSWVLRSPCLR
jgi:hypothetical protein